MLETNFSLGIFESGDYSHSEAKRGMRVPAPLGQMRERRARSAEAYLMYVAGAGGRSLTKQMVRRRRRYQG
jgi:hypothetical protein